MEYAKKNNLKRICVTDHYWDSEIDGASEWYSVQNFEHISKIKPLPCDDDVEFLFGCETEMDRFFNIGIPRERFDDLDFIIIPTTHLNTDGFTISYEDTDSNERRATLWVERLRAVLNMDLPFHKIGIAHPVSSLMSKGKDEYLKTLKMISDDDMRELFSRAAEVGCGIEINHYDMRFSDEDSNIILRPLQIAKECGCKFYIGSDAHHPDTFEKCIAILERAIDLLELRESDKFHLEKR